MNALEPTLRRIAADSADLAHDGPMTSDVICLDAYPTWY